MKALPLLALALLAAPAGAAALDSTQTFAAQVLLQPSKISVSDTSPDNASLLIGDIVTRSVAAFDPAQGVLTGVQGRVSVDPGHGLMAYRTESGGSWDSISTLRSSWTLGGQFLAAPNTVLQRVVSNRDTLVVIGTDWAGMSFSTASGLDRFVGRTPLVTTLSTTLGAFISGGGGGSVAIASVLAMNGGAGGPDLDGLTAGIEWRYEWLRHAQLSFDASAAQDRLSLDLGAGDAGFALHALGDTATTRADLLGWSCTGDCSAFTLQLAAAQDLAAGASLAGQVSFIGGAGAHAASFVLQVADDAAVGAAASRATHTLTLAVQAGVVPEPPAALLLLAGLGWGLWRGRLPSRGAMAALRGAESRVLPAC